MLEAAGGVPLELHSHCTTGLAPAVYAEAMRQGIRYLHTGVPPAADGSAQPSVLDVAHNARVLGLEMSRIQFTPDLMPADVTGSVVYDRRSGVLSFQKGPIFANLVLGDEIALYARPALEHVAARPADTPLVERQRMLHGGLRVGRSHGAAQTDGVTARQLNAANVGVVACEESRRLQISLSLDGPHGLAPERDRQLSPSRGSDHWGRH